VLVIERERDADEDGGEEENQKVALGEQT